MANVPFYAIVLPVKKAGIGYQVTTKAAKSNQYGVFTFSNSKTIASCCVAVFSSSAEALNKASEYAEEVITSMEIVHTVGSPQSPKCETFWTVNLINRDGDTFWLDDCWNKESALNMACSYGQPVVLREAVAELPALAA